MEPAEIVDDRRRQVFDADEIEVETGCPDVGENRSGCADLRAVRQAHANGPAAPHDDPLDRPAAFDSAATRFEPADERRRQ